VFRRTSRTRGDGYIRGMMRFGRSLPAASVARPASGLVVMTEPGSISTVMPVSQA